MAHGTLYLECADALDGVGKAPQRPREIWLGQ